MDLKEKYKLIDQEINQLEQDMKELRKHLEGLNENLKTFDSLKDKLETLKLDKHQMNNNLILKSKSIQTFQESKLKSLIYSVFGGKEEKVKKLNQELIELKNAYEASCLEIEKHEIELKCIDDQIKKAHESNIKLKSIVKKRNELANDRLELHEILNRPNLEDFFNTTTTEKKLNQIREQASIYESIVTTGTELLETIEKMIHYLTKAIHGTLYTNGNADLTVRRHNLQFAKDMNDHLIKLIHVFSKQLQSQNCNYTFQFEFNMPKLQLISLMNDFIEDRADREIKSMLPGLEKDYLFVEKQVTNVNDVLMKLKEEIESLESEFYLKLKYKD